MTKKHINKFSFELSLFGFLFLMVNREFTPFIDIRYLIVLFSITAVLTSDIKFKDLCSNFSFNVLNLFLVYNILSAIIFMKSDLFVPELSSTTINLVILTTYNLLMTITFLSNKDKISLRKIIVLLSISILLNLVSVLYLYLQLNSSEVLAAVDVKKLPFTNINGFVMGEAQKNLLGQKFRIAGYSEDANYLTFNAIILLILLFKNKDFSKKFRFSFMIISMLLIIVSASKTLIAALALIIIFQGIGAIMKKNLLNFNYIWVILLFFTASLIFSSLIGNFDFGISFNNRLVLWQRSMTLFYKNIFFGGGFSSFRHLGFSFDWVVHSHNLFIQIMSETGLVGAFMFTVFASTIFNALKNNNLKVVSLIFLIFGLTFDLSYTDFIPFVFVLLPLADYNIKGEKIRIFQVSNGLSNGGAERMVYDLSTRLSDDKNYDVKLLLTDPEDPNNTVQNLFDLDNISFEVIRLSNKKHDFMTNNFKIASLIRKEKPDIIHTHQITLIYCFVGYLFGGSNLKVHTVHNDSNYEFGSKAFRQLYHILFVVFRVKLVSISSYILETSIKEYFLLDKSMHNYIYNGRSIENITLADGANSIFSVIMVGRLTDVKNHIEAVRIFDRIVNDLGIKDINLKIFGDGPNYDLLKEEIELLKLEDYVVLCGVTDNISQELAKADLFFMTSVHEGFPISAIEALSCSLPLVLSNFGSAFELVSNQNGYTYSLGNIDEAAMHICELRSNYDLHKKFSKNSNTLSNKFSLENMVNEYDLFYKERLV